MKADRAASRAVRTRREPVESSLKEIEDRDKRTRSPPLHVRITQAGVPWTKQQYMIGSAILPPLGEACAKLFEGMPLAEANFFAIVIAIQQKSGGNLSEALGNLSKVLRDRKKMKGKIKAMSTEATASAAIIGALPIAVMAVVYLTSPDYITLLWTDRRGQMMLAASAVWMSIGVFVMKKMINFDF